MRRPRMRTARGIPLRAVLPNVITAAALCSGLTGIRFALSEEWERAVLMIVIAAVLDGIDGRVARLVRGESRFGAELDSLSDAISFGVSPALILFLWSLHEAPRIGWMVALVYAVFTALRLARFNARIDVVDQPHKSAGFLTGIPAPAGAGLALLPLYAWIWSGEKWFQSPWLVVPWVGFVAFLMVSSLATYSWTSFKLRRHIRFEIIAIAVVVAAALVTAPWQALTALALAYLASLPFSILGYRRVRRLRATAPASPPES